MIKVYRNIGYLFLILLVFVIAGFFKTYFVFIPNFPATTTRVIHFHALVLSAWVLLLIVQPLLIRYKKLKLHRMVGKSAYVLAPLVVASFIALMFKHYHDQKMETWTFRAMFSEYYFQGLHTLQFTLFYILAMLYKKNVTLHGGYMIATGFIFINPSLLRVFLLVFAVPYPWAQTFTSLVTDGVILSLLFFIRSKGLDYRFLLVILATFLLYDIPMMLKVWG